EFRAFVGLLFAWWCREGLDALRGETDGGFDRRSLVGENDERCRPAFVALVDDLASKHAVIGGLGCGQDADDRCGRGTQFVRWHKGLVAVVDDPLILTIIQALLRRLGRKGHWNIVITIGPDR